MVSPFIDLSKEIRAALNEHLLKHDFELYVLFGKNEDNSLKIKLSREELASLIGTATESCIRLLSEFNKLGMIELNGKKIVLKNIGKLKKMAE